MTAKHTPGPWHVGRPKRILDMDARGAIYIHGKDVTIASILDGEREANAELIAASPALFEQALRFQQALRQLRDRQWNERDLLAMAPELDVVIAQVAGGHANSA
jgi:hypothetical protein